MVYKLHIYAISSDGETYTEQWLTEQEAQEEKEKGYTVLQKDPTIWHKEIII